MKIKTLPTIFLTPPVNDDKSQTLFEVLSFFVLDFLVRFKEKNQWGTTTELTESDLNLPKLL